MQVMCFISWKILEPKIPLRGTVWSVIRLIWYITVYTFITMKIRIR